MINCSVRSGPGRIYLGQSGVAAIEFTLFVPIRFRLGQKILNGVPKTLPRRTLNSYHHPCILGVTFAIFHFAGKCELNTERLQIFLQGHDK